MLDNLRRTHDKQMREESDKVIVTACMKKRKKKKNGIVSMDFVHAASLESRSCGRYAAENETVEK